MASLYTHQDSNRNKTWFLMTMFLVLIVIFGWVLSLYFETPIILYLAVGFSLLMNFLAYWNSDKIVLAISGAKPVKYEEHPDLYNVVENLAITAGLPKPKIYIIDDPVPNAFATGRNPEHGVIAFTTGLLRILDRSEIEGVAAHEMAHIGNRDTLLQTAVVILVGFITIMADIFFRSAFHSSSDRRDGRLGLIIIIAAIVLSILAPIAAQLIKLAISRKREFMADASGALLTRYPEGLASALEKISGHSGKMKKASHAMAHMYISDPYGTHDKKDKTVSFLSRMFMTHPPVENRVAALRGFDF